MTGGYERGGNKTSRQSDIRKHDEMGGARESGEKASRRPHCLRAVEGVGKVDK